MIQLIHNQNKTVFAMQINLYTKNFQCNRTIFYYNDKQTYIKYYNKLVQCKLMGYTHFYELEILTTNCSDKSK